MIEGAPRGDGRGFGHRDFPARLRLFPPGQFRRQQLRKNVGRDRAAILDVEQVRREATELVPRNHVRRGFGGDFFRAVTGKGFSGNKTEADAIAKAEKTNVCRQMPADFGQRFVAAGGGEAIGLGIERLFQFQPSAFPFGNFQTSAQFRFDFIKRMGEQTRQQRRAGGALDELSGTREQTEDQAHQGRRGKVARRDVHQQPRPGGQGGPGRLVFGGGADELVEPMGVTEFLVQQGLQVLDGQLTEERVQPAGEGCGG